MSQPVLSEPVQKTAAPAPVQKVVVPQVEAESAAEQEPEKDYSFVQTLLDKIAELEKSPDAVSTEEIRKLRIEVDKAIKSMQEE